PAYMMPQVVLVVDSFPLTLNGKLDFTSLPEPGLERHSDDFAFEAPANKTEENILIVWKEILQLETISVVDNFFEIGGNSLKIVKLYHRLSGLFPEKISIS